MPQNYVNSPVLGHALKPRGLDHLNIHLDIRLVPWPLWSSGFSGTQCVCGKFRAKPYPLLQVVFSWETALARLESEHLWGTRWRRREVVWPFQFQMDGIWLMQVQETHVSYWAGLPHSVCLLQAHFLPQTTLCLADWGGKHCLNPGAQMALNDKLPPAVWVQPYSVVHWRTVEMGSPPEAQNSRQHITVGSSLPRGKIMWDETLSWYKGDR